MIIILYTQYNFQNILTLCVIYRSFIFSKLLVFFFLYIHMCVDKKLFDVGIQISYIFIRFRIN